MKKRRFKFYYVLQHKKFKTVHVLNNDIDNPGYLKFTNYLCALAYKIAHGKRDFKIIKLPKEIDV